MKHKKILSLLIVSLMVVPAGAILSSNFGHSDKTGGGTTVSLYRDVNSILRNSTLSRERLSYNPNRMHTHILKNSIESSTVSNQVFQFDNITGQYQSALNGPVGTFDMAANNESVAILLYTNSGNSTNLTICYKNGTTMNYDFNSTTMNYDFNSLLNLSVVERLYSLGTGYILEGYSKSTYLWFTVSSSGVSIVNFTGLIQSNIFIAGTSGSDIFIDYSPNISFSLNNSNPHNYFLEYSDNGSLVDNFTKNLNIPLNLSVCYAIQNGSNIFLTGYYSYIDAGQVSFDFAIGKIDISTDTFSFVQKWNGTSDSITDPQNLYVVSKTWVVGNNLYMFGGLDYFYIHNGTIRIKSCGGNLSTFSMINGSFHFENLSFPSDSIMFYDVAVIGDTAFVTLNKCNYSETNDNISYDYFSNYYYLLNQTQTGLTLDNVTSYFGQYATMVCATTFNGSIYLGSNYVTGCCGPSSHLVISIDPSTMQYSVLPISSKISISESVPSAWTSESSYGDNGVLTVGGNGFDFYNLNGFHAAGDISTTGFLLGSAWNGNMFMLVGQKYFESFYPTEGVLAYIYFPQNNTLKDITGLFSPSLSENATLVSVSAVGDNFIIAGIDNAMSTKQDILFIYNSSSGTLTNITNSLPSISDVCR
ncbi:MAG: hypothetical protein M1113_03465, partial [Candidatus Thermoplasmatota archaeon]|nr:hypothetical protein [Candidatus Thermoplasmatota archaeon]